MALNVADLAGNHEQHDDFIRTYLSGAGDDCVLRALTTQLTALEQTKPNLVDFVTKLMLTDVDTSSPNAGQLQQLALYILLTQYAENWKNMFQSAYELLRSILIVIRDSKKNIYPPKWTEKVFRLENFLPPDGLKGIMFGIDPISKKSVDARSATGYAFVFDQPDGSEEDISSSRGLKNVYYLEKTISLLRPDDVEERLTEPHGIALVNFIRTIEESSWAGSGNGFKEPWITYNLKWLTWLDGLPNGCTDRVLVFQNERFVFNDFSKSLDFETIKRLLTSAPRCSHPSYIQAEKGHCLWKPKTRNGTNASVTDFIAFLKRNGADDCCRCRCERDRPDCTNDQEEWEKFDYVVKMLTNL